jgi:hypothetical protein
MSIETLKTSALGNAHFVEQEKFSARVVSPSPRYLARAGYAQIKRVRSTKPCALIRDATNLAGARPSSTHCSRAVSMSRSGSKGTTLVLSEWKSSSAPVMSHTRNHKETIKFAGARFAHFAVNRGPIVDRNLGWHHVIAPSVIRDEFPASASENCEIGIVRVENRASAVALFVR